MTADLKTFYNVLQDKPLNPDDPYYVAYIENQPDDPIAAITQKISWSESATLELLSGQRGCGKSTQLRRLKKQLEAESCMVFLCDMKDYLNLSMPVEIGDFLISLLTSLSQEVAANTKLGDPAKQSYMDRITTFLQNEVKVEKIKSLGLKASLKDDPDFKKTLQAALKGHTASLVRQAQEFVQVDVVAKLRKLYENPHLKLVLLVDSVEQLRGEDEVHKSVETLFAVHGEHLRFPGLHVVYTVPPYLLPLAPGIGRNLGATLRTLPSVHVRQRNGNDDQQGLTTLKTMLSRRFAAWQEVISEAHMNEIARCTGGDLRDFFRLIREVLVIAPKQPGDWPIAELILQTAKNILQREMVMLAQEDMDWLIRIYKTKTPELPSVTQLPKLARFFDTHLVLNYRNGDDWYDVHPLLMPLLDTYIAQHPPA